MITPKDCTGCSACIEVCPKECITLGKDDFGAEKVVVDETLCIKCGLCSSVCQLENPISLSSTKKILVAARTDKTNFERTTSAGIATLISMQFIKQGGYVIGVRWDKQSGKAMYDIAETLDALSGFQGSKYVYPTMIGIYKKVKELLQNKRVLFIGLPCHIAAMKKYLGKENENLFTVDLLCHGAPEKSYLDEHLKSLGLGGNIESVSFRNGSTYRLLAKTSDKQVEIERHKDTYLYGFLNGLIQKEYCYSCRYAYSERVGDLTLGDAWGQTILKADRTELVAINNEKGGYLWNTVSDQLVSSEYDLVDFNANNQQMKKPTKQHSKRKVFLSNLKSQGFERASKIALRNEMLILRVRKALSKIKNKLRR